MSTSPPSYLLPYTTLQPTYSQVYKDVLSSAESTPTTENVWLSLYSDNAPRKSIHATMQLALKERDSEEVKDQVSVELIKGGGSIIVKERVGSTSALPDLEVSTSSSTLNAQSPCHLQSSPSLPSTTRLRLPLHTISSVLHGRRSDAILEKTGGGGQIFGFDVAKPFGGSTQWSYVASGEDGECKMGEFPSWVGGGAPVGQGTDAMTRQTSEQTVVEGESEEAGKDRKANGKLIWKQREARQQMKEYVARQTPADINVAMFLPSGEAALSVIALASSDLSIGLYGLATPPVKVRDYKTHKRRVTSLVKIGKYSRRFLSASLDGTIKAWDVPGNRCIKTIGTRGYSGVEGLAVRRLTADDDVEDGKGEYLLYAALSSGYIQIFSLCFDVADLSEPSRNRKLTLSEMPLVEIPPVNFPSSLPEDKKDGPGASDWWSIDGVGSAWSIDIDSTGQWMVVGCKYGAVRVFELDEERLKAIKQEKETAAADAAASVDVAGPSAYKEVFNFKRNSAGINKVRFLESTSTGQPPDAVIATADGTPFRLTFVSSGNGAFQPRVAEEYTGWEAGESVEGIGLLGDHIALAGAEGCIRVY